MGNLVFLTSRCLASQQGVNPGALIALWVVGDYLSFVVNFSPLITPFLTPVKSGIFQLVGDATGWGIRVSVPFCTIAMFIYAWLFVLTLAILLHLHKNRTGLKWNPCTLATQLSMIQGSDLFDELVDIPPGERAPLNSAVRSWPKKKMLLRLGYWRELGTDHIIYGIRFLPGEEPLQIDSGMERAAGGGNVGGRPDFVDVSATTVSYGRGRELDGYMKSGSDRGRVSSHMDSSPAHFAETASNDHRATASTYNEPTLVRQRPRSAQPDVDRIWNCWLRDFYLVVITLIGTAALITATITWAKGYIYRPFHFPVPSREKHGSEGQNTSMGQDLVRNIVFDLLPSALFGIFNLSLLSADVYQRCMMPIENMASPLPEEDRKRLSFEEEHIKGATARESMLLDYISLDIISCIVAAISGGHYRIILGAVLATLSNAVFIVVGRVFAVGKGDASGYSVSIQPRNFYASFAIMVVYCISIWILRPRGVTRTCRPVFTLMDLAVLVHQSHILQCPEFWLESSSDTEEHMKGQVMLANRLYRFGVFTGMDDHDHVGISIHEVPRAWIRRNPEDIPHLRYSMELARDVLKFGLCDESSVAFAHDFLTTGPRTQLKLRKVYSNDYHRWSQMVKRLIGKTSKKDAEEGLNDDSGDNTSHDVTEGRSSSYQRREGNSESAHPRGLDSELSEVLPRV